MMMLMIFIPMNVRTIRKSSNNHRIVIVKTKRNQYCSHSMMIIIIIIVIICSSKTARAYHQWVKFGLFMFFVIYLELVESFETMTTRLANISRIRIDLQIDLFYFLTFCAFTAAIARFIWIDQIYRSIADKHTIEHTHN